VLININEHKNSFFDLKKRTVTPAASTSNIASMYVDASTQILFGDALGLSNQVLFIVVVATCSMMLFGVNHGKETEQKRSVGSS
jgi:hypothetical protein